MNKIPKGWIDNVTQGDCLELIKYLPDKCVDLVVTDPPYEVDYSNKSTNLEKIGNGRASNRS